MAVTMSVDEMRRVLANPEAIPERAFELVQTLCAMASDGSYTGVLQELVLRALERRAYFGDIEIVLNGLVRTVGLFPYLPTSDLSPRDLLAYEFHRPVNMDDDHLVFHRVQAEVYRLLLDGRSVILSAPTSFGKSLIIDAIIATKEFHNILIIVPTIALIDETRRRLSRFGGHYKLITHATQRPEVRNIYVLTQERAVELEGIYDIDFFVIDEFYKLQPDRDSDRSLTLNHALYKLLKKGVQFYMLGPNIDGIPPGFPEQFECTFIRTNYATVVSEVHPLPKQGDRRFQLVELCERLEEQTLIYCASPTRANKVVQWLVESGVTEKEESLKGAVNWLGREYHESWQLTLGLGVGIGLHHGRVPRSIAEFMVRAFNEGVLRFLVCTSTLIEGVNTKAKNVVIFDNKVARRKFDYFTFNNIRGRSGRMFQHFVGRVYLFDPPPEAELPFVDIPMYSQDESASESLLVQMEQNDLTEQAKNRMAPILEQTVLDIETIRGSTGISPEAQIELAKELESRIRYYHSLLSWRRIPNYDELETACKLIWKFLVENPRRLSGVSSGRQLAFKINQLRRLKEVKALIQNEMNDPEADPNDAVEGVLDFVRNWAGFHFPRYLACLDRIQKAVFGRSGRSMGDYAYFGGQVENLFLDPTLLALEEYGVPLQVSQKIEHVLAPDGDLDGVLSRMRTVDVESLELDEFETRLLSDAQQHL